MDPKHNSNVGISANLDVKTEVPSGTAARTIDAVTDLIRPVSETFGLIGDKISLYRQNTLTKIAKIVKERADIGSKPELKLAPKYLVPLLEKASLEDIDDDTLMDMWANLLITSSTERVQMLGQYINVLSNVTAEQIKILEGMLGANIDNSFSVDHMYDIYYTLNQSGLMHVLSRLSKKRNLDKFCEILVGEINLRGVVIDNINIFHKNDVNGGRSISSPDGIYTDKKYMDFENLVRMGLIDRVEIKNQIVGIFDVDIIYYIINPVGADLYACCNPKRLKRGS